MGQSPNSWGRQLQIKIALAKKLRAG